MRGWICARQNGFLCVDKYNLAQYSSAGVPWNPSVPQNM